MRTGYDVLTMGDSELLMGELELAGIDEDVADDWNQHFHSPGSWAGETDEQAHPWGQPYEDSSALSIGGLLDEAIDVVHAGMQAANPLGPNFVLTNPTGAAGGFSNAINGTFAPTGQKAVVATKDAGSAGDLRVRATASATGQVVGSLARGTIVDVTGPAQSGWTPIAFGSIKGFCSSAFLKVATSTSAANLLKAQLPAPRQVAPGVLPSPAAVLSKLGGSKVPWIVGGIAGVALIGGGIYWAAS